MAGRGFAPKDPDRRARRNKDPIATTVLAFVAGEQPPLPDLIGIDGEEINWHPMTVQWWEIWGETSLAATFTDVDWSFLLDTAILHHRLWHGDMKAAPELRLRVAKFGATPEDRARLRIVFADADEKDTKRGQPVSSGGVGRSGPYRGLSAVPEGGKG